MSIDAIGATRRKGPADLNRYRLKQDGQDFQDIQDEEEKGLEDLNVYRTEAQSGEKVREDLNSYSHPGADCFWRRGAIILFILAILLQTTKTRAGPIKVLTDLVLLFLLRVYRHSGPIGPGVHPANPAHPGHPDSDS